MTEKRDHPARPEQPGAGGFEEGEQTLPDDEQVGKFSEGNETPSAGQILQPGDRPWP
ncbi:MAG: hypothetical protein M3P44_01200 [Actinomycetota bacterium]|nr:hypothetical protein [Actinomycetota bacterium]MDP9344339.1 hypothetical protein [Actinomycetota bacterium]